jgi:hypothetical protein
MSIWKIAALVMGGLLVGVVCVAGEEPLPKGPALPVKKAKFHSNWQWWQIVKNARPIILDETPADYRPIIHVIDNFARNHKLGLLFETKVGKGKLLVCASDLPALQAYPEARQQEKKTEGKKEF